LLDQPELLQGEGAIARLRFQAPLFLFVGDRFILRDSSAQQTIAGGLVLDADADETKFRSPAQRTFLNARAAAPNDLVVLLRTQLRRDNFVSSETLLLKSNFSREEIEAAIDELVRRGALFRCNEVVADAAWWQALRNGAEKAIDAEHAAHPNHPGMELTQLRATLEIRDLQLFGVLVEHLSEHGFARAGSAIRRADHRPSLPPQLESAGAAIRGTLAAHPFDPPSRKELIRDARTQEALRFLCQTGEVLLLNDDVVVSGAAFAQMQTRVTQVLRLRGTATTSELRQVLGTPRRILVPLLERLDRAGLTIRQGDRRALREHAPAR
jgi:selenocysteine-specific elongation factor